MSYISEQSLRGRVYKVLINQRLPETKENEGKDIHQDEVMSLNRDKVSNKGNHIRNPYSMTQNWN